MSLRWGKLFVVLSCGFVFAGALSSCAVKDMIYAIPKMNSKLSETNSKLMGMSSDMNQLVSGTEEIKSLPQLMSYSNYSELSPFPYKLMPWGAMFASVVTAQQLAPIAHLWLIEINTLQPEQQVDASGNPIPPTQSQMHKIDTIKFGRLSALMTVAANLPESTVTQLIQDQIINGGQYEGDAFTLLALRAFFINDMLSNDPVYQQFQTVGAFKHAVTYASAVDRVARLPYVKQLQFSVNFLEKNYDGMGNQIQFTMNPSMAPTIWNEIQMEAANDLSFNKPGDILGNPAADLARMKKHEAEYNAQMKIVRARVQYWQK